ncbi:outer membrane protein assembly factor BamD [Porphyromonadaceae bacterium W3.11]|nr:outer membrane protein assembly factor BamD [Porphyromonadaceae bacterium W3.11]
MRKIIKLALMTLLLSIGLTSCNEYTKVQKSTDVMEKYSYAKKYYNTGKYSWAASLLDEVVPYLKGTTLGEQALYLQAQSHYSLKNYQEAQMAFKQYYTNYPNGEYAELARFYSGYGLAQNIPDPRLDQSKTYEAMKELQLFIDYYPQHERAEEAKTLLFELQENLALKEVLNAQLYYNLGNYIFNNYESCIITARAAMKEFPYSMHKEEMHYYVVASLYEIAKNSVIDKQQQRLRDLRDEYYNFINEFPNGKRRKEVDAFFEYAEKHINKDAM